MVIRLLWALIQPVFPGQLVPGSLMWRLTKYNSTGTGLIYSTYIGGTEAEIVTSLVVDASNNPFVFMERLALLTFLQAIMHMIRHLTVDNP